MRVSFPRLPDGQRAYCVAERSDGVRYRVHEGIASSRIPHDLVHLVVERETAEDGGFWGAVAAGAVFESMEHVGGRRPPHASERSGSAVRARRDRLLRAELMAGLVGHVAEHAITAPNRIQAVARDVLSTLPDTSVDAELVSRAAQALREMADRWAGLRVGGEVTVEWPEPRPRRRRR